MPVGVKASCMISVASTRAIRDAGFDLRVQRPAIQSFPRSTREFPMTSVHVPVMLREVLQGLELTPGLTVVDGTVGGGGHSLEIAKRISPGGRLLGLDRDPMMLILAEQKLTGPEITLRQASYVDLPRTLSELGWPGVDRILVDLGLSSDQLADDSRSFSFRSKGDLDLRFDRTQGVSAAELLVTASVEELDHIFRDFGEEPRSRQVAEHLVRQRSTQPIRTGVELAEAVLAALHVHHSDRDTHPATRVFQALRIAVNHELEYVQQAIEKIFPACLKPGGILAVISFHSLEDRLVKQALRNVDVWEPITSKPIAPTPAETRFNPRSRSAKLRLARRK